MAPVGEDEDEARVGDDSTEESNTAVVKDETDEKSEQESSGETVGGSFVDSLMGTAKLATGFLPSSVRRSKDQADFDPASGNGVDTELGKEARTSESQIGEDPSRADEVIDVSSLGGTITDVVVEGWSVVDRLPEKEAKKDEALSESHSSSAEWEEETPELDDPNISMQTDSEILEEESQTRPFVSSSSLRRRPLSSSKRTKDDASAVSFVGAHISPLSESIDIASIAEGPTAFELRNAALSGASGHMEVGSQLQNEGDESVAMTDLTSRNPRSLWTGREDDDSVVNFVGAHVSRFSESFDIAAIAERPDTFEPQYDSSSGSLGDTEIESQLQTVDEDTVSKPISLNVWRRKKEWGFGSGYNPELEGDDNDVRNASSMKADDVGLWNGADLSQRRGQWEGVASSSDLGGKPSVPETSQTRGAYRMPGSEAEGEDNGGEHPPQVLVQPAGFVVQAIEFQLNLIVHMLAIGIWLVNFTFSSLSYPITRTVKVKDKVTSVTAGTANQVLEALSHFGDGISQAGPDMSKLSKKTFWGCLAVAYVVCVLGFLLIPALFADIIIVNIVAEKPLVIRQALDFDYTQPRPVSLLPLFPAKEIERVKDLPLDKVVKTRVIPQGSKFHVTVSLTLPESDYNMKLGMFQVTAELLSARDRVILRSSKPCRLRYRSFPIQVVKTLVYAVPNLVGLSNEAQTIEIRLLEAQEKLIPTASVRILLEPKARVRDLGGVPDIYKASVRLESILPWPRSVITRWKWLFFLWNGVCLFLFEVAIILCCCRQVLIPRFGKKTVAEEEIVLGEVKYVRATREAPRDMRSSRKGRSNRRVCFEDDILGAEYSIREE